MIFVILYVKKLASIKNFMFCHGFNGPKNNTLPLSTCRKTLEREIFFLNLRFNVSSLALTNAIDFQCCLFFESL